MNKTVKSKLLCRKCRPEDIQAGGAVRDAGDRKGCDGPMRTGGAVGKDSSFLPCGLRKFIWE